MDYVSHSGVLNMKWGQRRYQNPDGSLTDLGRKHYGVGPPRKPGEKAVPPTGIARARKAKQVQNNVDPANQLKKPSNEKPMTKEDVIKSGDYATINRYRSQLSDDELRKAMDRVKLERELQSFAPKPAEKKQSAAKETGKKLIDNLLNETSSGLAKGVGKAGTALAGAATMYAGKALVTKLLGEDKSKAIFDDDLMKILNTNLGQKLK